MYFLGLRKSPQRMGIGRNWIAIKINDLPQNGLTLLKTPLTKKPSSPKVSLLLDYLKKYNEERHHYEKSNLS